MDLHDQIAIETMQSIETCYPEFLTEAGLEESLFTRMMYYNTLLEVLADNSQPETRSKELLIDMLTTRRINAMAELKLELLGRI